MESATCSDITDMRSRNTCRSPKGACTKSRNLAKSISKLLNTPTSRRLLLIGPTASNNNINNNKIVDNSLENDNVNSQVSSLSQEQKQERYKQDSQQVPENHQDKDLDDLDDLDAWLAQELEKVKKDFKEKWNFSLKDDAPMNGLWKWI